MIYFKTLVTAACLALVIAVPAAARTVHYDCSLNVPRSQSWIPTSLQLDQDTDTGRVTVFGPIIRYFIGKPVVGTIDTENTRRVTFKWVLHDIQVPNSNERAPALNYSATIVKARNSVQVTMNPASFDNSFQAAGICRIK